MSHVVFMALALSEMVVITIIFSRVIRGSAR